MDFVRFLLCCIIAVSAASAEDLARVDLDKLRDPARCEAEVGRLVIKDDEKSEKLLTSWRVHEAAQGAAEPLHVLLASHEYDFSSSDWHRGYQIEDPDELFAPPGAKQLGKAGSPSLEPVIDHVLYVFDHKGREIRPFGGNNYMGLRIRFFEGCR